MHIIAVATPSKRSYLDMFAVVKLVAVVAEQLEADNVSARF